jgi:hypothetical protein
LLEEKQLETATLKDDARVYRDLEARVKVENDDLTRRLAVAKVDNQRLTDRVAELKTTIADHRQLEKQYDLEIAALKRKLESYEDPEDAEGLAATFGELRLWIWAGAGAIVGAMVVIGILVFNPRSRTDLEMDEGFDEETEKDSEDGGKEPPKSTNNDLGD